MSLPDFRSPAVLAVASIALLAGVQSVLAQTEPVIDQQRAAMIRRIDQLLAERWRDEGVSPAPAADDSEFLRRAYLDLTGVVPRVAEVRAFLSDKSLDKRRKLIDRLLDSPAHASHLAAVWRKIMLPGGFDAAQLQDAAGMQNWFREQFVTSMRYDRIVNDFLVATGRGEAGPALFYTSRELKPAKLASSTARIFLGVQIECAQCHDHPLDSRWSQHDFWGYAAFFARLRQPGGDQAMMQAGVEDLQTGEVMLPDSDDVVSPKYPGGRSIGKNDRGTRREQLAVWVAGRDNPYLARAAANRAWAQLFGRGIVEPVDDFGPHNPPSHPQLLDELAAYFVKSGYDLPELHRTLAGTAAYQLSSQSDEDALPPELFARMAIKTLTPEQLYDSLNRVLARPPASSAMPLTGGLLDPRRQAFVAKMQTLSRSATDFQAGVPQALTLMNGAEIRDASHPQRGGLLTALNAPWFTNEQRVEIIFLATLSRAPRDDERAVFNAHVDRGASSGKLNEALGDVLWAVLNSAEFSLNH